MLDVLPEGIEERAGLSRALERGQIVRFPSAPVPLPSAEDQRFLREELGRDLTRKNVSWYPDGDRLVGVDGALRTRVRATLATHAAAVDAFLARTMPAFMRGARRGTSSFRPIQEQGRQLSAHASNELVHIDAGAYGATHGDRILRFFVNLNPVEDRVWATRGTLAEILQHFGPAAGITTGPRLVQSSLAGRLYSAVIRGTAAVVPALRMVDSSPYDRAMRKLHNFMKDSPAFRDSTEGLEQISFKPFSAWMVLTDTVSHACLSGQFALVDTFLIPAENCTERDQLPLALLARPPSPAEAAA